MASGNGVMKYIDPDLEKIIDTIEEEHDEIESSVSASRELVQILKIFSSIQELDDVDPRDRDTEKKPSVKI